MNFNKWVSGLLVFVLMLNVFVFSKSEKVQAAEIKRGTADVGDDHTWVIKADGSLWAWGYNEVGQLGDGTYEDKNIPVKVMDNVVAAYRGYFHSLAIKEDGSLWTWGWNLYGLGDGTNEYSNIPIKIMDNVESVSTGGCHTIAIKEDGSLWAWGWNVGGQLGDGTNEDKNIPVKIMDNVVTVLAKSWNTLAIKEDGSLWTWGDNYHGQLGDGTNEDKNTPVKIMDSVVAVSATDISANAIKADGSLWAWGSNEVGQLGDGTYEDKNIPVKVMDNVAAVSAGTGHTEIIKEDGSLWAWGYNWFGQLGDGTNEFRGKPVKVMDNAVAVSAGEWYVGAIKTDGSLWTWGDNEYGQLGDGTTKNRNEPVKIMDNVVAVSVRTIHTVVIKEDGSLWTWGNNYYGQLGNGTNENSSIPIKIMDGVKLSSNVAKTDKNPIYADTGYEVIKSIGTLNSDGNYVVSNFDSQEFVSVGQFSEFQNLYLNDNLLQRDVDYVAVEGSIRIKIKSQTMQTKAVNNSLNVLKAEFKNQNGEIKQAIQPFNLSVPITRDKMIVIYNGKTQDCDSVVKDGRSYVKARQLATETLGGKIDWNGEKREISVVLDGKSLVFTENSDIYYFDGRGKRMEEDESIFIQDGYTYVPVRFICEAYGMKVEYNTNTNVINIDE